jgi:hypothetical protein
MLGLGPYIPSKILSYMGIPCSAVAGFMGVIAQVGDLVMSLIHTCELSDANPFDYLTQLQHHASELEESPSDWGHGTIALRWSRWIPPRDRKPPNQEWLMPSSKKKSIKPTTCPACGGVDLVRKITTYPVLLSGPLEGKQIHVGRVAVHECLTCGHLMPTPAGQAKVDRDFEMGIRLFLGQLH